MRKTTIGRMRELAMICGAALALAACSGSGVAPEIERGVEEFHRRYDAGEMAAIYRSSAPVLREITPESTFVASFRRTREQLGPVEDKKYVGSSTLTSSRTGVRTIVRYETRFRSMTVGEEFVFVDVDGKPLLGGHTLRVLGAGGKTPAER